MVELVVAALLMVVAVYPPATSRIRLMVLMGVIVLFFLGLLFLRKWQSA